MTAMCAEARLWTGFDEAAWFGWLAERDRFRHIAFGIQSIGGRYSELSDFGMLPAVAMGIDIGMLLGPTQKIVRSCAASRS